MNWREEKLRQELLDYNIQIKDIANLDSYDDIVSEKVLGILLQWACYGQNIAQIMFGRRKIAEIPRAWLKSHLLNVIKYDFDYLDDWNYRRLLELTVDLVWELKNELLSLNSKSTNPDLIEVINDFK